MHRKPSGRQLVWKGVDLDRASIVAPEEPVTKEGHLEKLGRGAFSHYQKRYFVLRGHYLKYLLAPLPIGE